MYLFFDTETTGLPINWKAPVTDLNNWPRLVQLAFLLYDNNGNKISGGDFIINPDSFTIPVDASRIHRITTERAVREGISLPLVLQIFQSLLNQAEVLVAHNMIFDENVLGAEFLRLSMHNPIPSKRKICTMESTTDFCAINGPLGYKGPKLSELYLKLFRTGFDEAHDASIDIYGTVKCFWELVRIGLIPISTTEHNPSVELAEIITQETLNETVKDTDADFEIYLYDGLYGYKNKQTGNIICNAKYTEAQTFSEGRARVMLNDKFGFIGTNGEVVIPFIYDDAWKFHHGISSVRKGNKCGCIDANNNLIVPFEHSGIHSFVDNIFFASNWVGEEYLLDLNGNLLTTQLFHDIKNFSENLSNVSFGIKFKRKFDYDYEYYNKKWGYINKLGQLQIPLIYDSPCDFHDGIAVVSSNKIYRIIDNLGKDRIVFEYDEVNDFHEGLASFSLKGKWGFINKTGEIIIQPFFELVVSFSDGLAPAKIRGKWGVIDHLGEFVVPPSYDEIKQFSDGMAAYKCNYKWGFINKQGVQVIEPKYQFPSQFLKGIAYVKLELNYPFNINKLGERV